MKRLLLTPKVFGAFLLLNLLFVLNAFGQQTQKFTASGSFIVPAGVTSITVHAQGAGGGGGFDKAAGGGGGAYKSGTISVTPGNSIIITVGTGGTGQTSTTAAGNGGNSTVGTIIGSGGNGAAGSTVGTGGLGDKKGGNGVQNNGGGGGGGGAGSGTAGNDGSSMIGGTGGTGIYPGGIGGNGSSGAGNAVGGGGAGGNSTAIGGGGARGEVNLDWCATYALATSSATTPICSGNTSTVTLSSLTLNNGTYTVTYNLSGGNTATGLTASMTVSSSTGTFNTISLNNSTNSNVTTTVTVTNLTSGTCSNAISTNNTSGVTVRSTPAATISGTATVCQNVTSPNVTFTNPNSVSADVTYTINGVTQTILQIPGNGTVNVAALTTSPGAFNYVITSVRHTSATTCVAAITGQSAVVTIALNKTSSAASSTPTVCFNTAITNITHTTTGATGIANSGVPGANGLPAGVSATWASNTVTISGTPTASGPFAYSIPLTGGCGSVNATGGITVNAAPTLTGASTAPVCVGSSATINLTGLRVNSTSTINYTINGIAQTAVSSIVADGLGTASFSPQNLTAANDGQILQITAITTTSVVPNCTKSFSQNVTLTVSQTTVGGTVASSQTICTGTAPADLILSGNTGSVVKWQKSTSSNFSSGVTDIFVTSISLPEVTIGNLTATTYFRAVVKTGVCPEATSSVVTITVRPLPIATISGNANVCLNATAPNITFTGVVGTAPFTFTYKINNGPSLTVQTTSGNSVTIAASTNTAGIFAYDLVSVDDAPNSCTNTASGTATITVNSPPTPTITANGPTSFCTGGSVTLTASAASGNQWYQNGLILSGETAQTLLVTTSGGYTVFASNGTCTSAQSAPQPVFVNPTPTLTGASQASPVCAGLAATINLSGLLAGSTSTINYTINGVVQTAVTNVAASASGTASFNTAPLFTANDGQTLEITSVTITSATPACSASFTTDATLNVNAAVSAGTVSGTSPLCTSSTATYTATGSTTGGAWTSSNESVATVDINSGVVTAVVAGNTNIVYTVTTGCGSPVSSMQSLTVQISLIVSVSIAAVPGSTICGGTSVTFTATPTNGGTSPTYQWQKNGVDINGETAATYTSSLLANGNAISVMMTSNAGCITGSPAPSNAITMIVTTVPTAAISYNASPYCATGTATVIQTGQAGGTYTSTTRLVIDGATGAVNLVISAPGTYVVTYSFGSGNCSGTTTANITINQVPVLSTSVTHVTCNGTLTGAVNLTVTGPPTSGYSWTGPNSFTATTEDISGLAAGSYTVLVTSTGGCTATTIVTVNQPSLLTATASQTNNACHGGSNGSINVSAVGGTAGYTYTISGSLNTTGAVNGIFTGLTAGTYSVTVTDANTCTVTVIKTITEPAGITADVTLSVADFTDNYFPATATSVTLLYQVNEIGGNPALADLLRITKQAGYTFSLPSISTFTIGTGVNAITYTVDNSRWTADNANPIFYNIFINSGQQVACGQSVYLAIKLTRATPSKSVFTLTSQMRNVAGETQSGNNSTTFLLVGQ